MAASKIAKLAFVRSLKSATARFTLVTVYNDVLLCALDLPPNYPPAYLAKPFLLRRSVTTHNGVSFSYTSASQRTATKAGETDEEQFITPAYVVGDYLHAARYNATNDTELSLSDVSITLADVGWIDLNVDARAWAYDPNA